MSLRKTSETGVKLVKPILSLNRVESRRRVLELYRAWYRQAPYIVHDYKLKIKAEQVREKVREKFEANRHVKDIRVIDMLVIKGQMELKETVEFWKQACHVMSYFDKPHTQPPSDFMGKFLTGQ